MHHVIKGSIMIRVDDTRGFTINDNTINTASILSGPPSSSEEYFSLFESKKSLPNSNQASWTCESYHLGASIEDGTEQQLANVRGISVAAVSSLGTKKGKAGASTISDNVLTGFESAYANVIVGIDIQGLSEGVIVSGNYVNLDENAGLERNDQFIACRVREFASDNNVIRSNNQFVQEERWEEFEERRLGTKRTLSENHPPVNEWEYGGCPYGRE